MPENVTFRAETGPNKKKERPKELDGIVFVEVLKKGGKKEYKSSEPGRKIIILSESSLNPEPGQPYRVKIIEDTDPENPESGKFIAEIIPETTNEDPIFETETTVSFLGVILEKAKNGDERFVPKKEQYADFIYDTEVTLPLERDIAVAFLSGEPLLVEGGTSLGKTTTIREMCARLGWEIHYANLNGATDVEDLMGRYIPNPNKNKPEDPEYVFADGKVTSGLRQEDGKVKVIILDEFNASATNILIRLHEVLDSLERGGDVVLSEDASETVPTNKNRTKIIALMNPPGKGYLDRPPLDPAQIRRWVYKKLPSELPESTFSHATKSLFFGKRQEGQNITPDMFLRVGEQLLTEEQLEEIPGIYELEEKYEEFHKAAKNLLKNRKIAEDQPQPFTFDDRMEPRRVRDFILRFYRGDINKTFQQALIYYYANKLESEVDRKKIGELIRLVEYKPKIAESKRKGFERKEKTAKETPNQDITQFLSETLKTWGVTKEQLDRFTQNQEVQIISPQDLDPESLKNDTDASKLGQYTLNPETKDIDWESIDKSKVESLQLPDSYNTETLAKIAKYIQSQSKKLPGLEYYKYIIENPDKAPNSLKDGNYHFFFGSVFRNHDGGWYVPCVEWGGSSFLPYGRWLGGSWRGDFRAVLLET